MQWFLLGVAVGLAVAIFVDNPADSENFVFAKR